MKPVTRFTLTAPARLRDLGFRLTLRADGEPTRLQLPGKRIVAQFETDAGYVVITDFDTPFDETTTVVLLSRDLRPLSRRSIGTIWSFLPNAHQKFSVRTVSWPSPEEFSLHGYDTGGVFDFRIRQRSVPYLRPHLGMRHRAG